MKCLTTTEDRGWLENEDGSQEVRASYNILAKSCKFQKSIMESPVIGELARFDQIKAD